MLEFNVLSFEDTQFSGLNPFVLFFVLYCPVDQLKLKVYLLFIKNYIRIRSIMYV